MGEGAEIALKVTGGDVAVGEFEKVTRAGEGTEKAVEKLQERIKEIFLGQVVAEKGREIAESLNELSRAGITAADGLGATADGFAKIASGLLSGGGPGAALALTSVILEGATKLWVLHKEEALEAQARERETIDFTNDHLSEYSHHIEEAEHALIAMHLADALGVSPEMAKQMEARNDTQDALNKLEEKAEKQKRTLISATSDLAEAQRQYDQGLTSATGVIDKLLQQQTEVQTQYDDTSSQVTIQKKAIDDLKQSTENLAQAEWDAGKKTAESIRKDQLTSLAALSIARARGKDDSVNAAIANDRWINSEEALLSKLFTPDQLILEKAKATEALTVAKANAAEATRKETLALQESAAAASIVNDNSGDPFANQEVIAIQAKRAALLLEADTEGQAAKDKALAAQQEIAYRAGIQNAINTQDAASRDLDLQERASQITIRTGVSDVRARAQAMAEYLEAHRKEIEANGNGAALEMELINLRRQGDADSGRRIAALVLSNNEQERKNRIDAQSIAYQKQGIPADEASLEAELSLTLAEAARSKGLEYEIKILNLRRIQGEFNTLAQMNELKKIQSETKITTDVIGFGFGAASNAIGSALTPLLMWSHAQEELGRLSKDSAAEQAAASAAVTQAFLADLAKQAAVKAIFETGEGFAALARYDGPAAVTAFTSAAVFGGIAIGTGLGAIGIGAARGNTAAEDAQIAQARGDTSSSSNSSSNPGGSGSSAGSSSSGRTLVVNITGGGGFLLAASDIDRAIQKATAYAARVA